MSDDELRPDPEVEATLQALYASIDLDGDGRWAGRAFGLRLGSQFQPVFSFPHGRAVGHEALVRPMDADGRPVSPATLFRHATGFPEQLWLDRLCRLVHVHNFCAQMDEAGDSWLFLNIHPAVFLQSAQHTGLLRRAASLLQSLGMPMHRLVLEVTEDVMALDHDFEAAVAWVRDLGCLIALDDFGAGHSNFDRVWRIRPDIVKLDRCLLQRASGSRRVARLLGQMVALLHEGGALALLEGVETPEEAEIALDADVDLVQGYAFGRPGDTLVPAEMCSTQIAAVWERFDAHAAEQRQQRSNDLAAVHEALRAAAEALQRGDTLAQAASGLLALPDTQLVFCLDAQGCAKGAPLAPAGCEGDPRFAPLHAAGDGRWARRPYFQRAVHNPGKVQMTRPYLSLRGSGLCLTLSLAVPGAQGLVVLCVDVDAA